MIFALTPPPDSLPVQGLTPETRDAGAQAATHAAARRGRLADRYLALINDCALLGATDHEAAHALRVPVSSICSTRAGRLVRDRIQPHGHRRGPYGELNTVWCRR